MAIWPDRLEGHHKAYRPVFYPLASADGVKQSVLPDPADELATLAPSANLGAPRAAATNSVATIPIPASRLPEVNKPDLATTLSTKFTTFATLRISGIAMSRPSPGPAYGNVARLFRPTTPDNTSASYVVGAEEPQIVWRSTRSSEFASQHQPDGYIDAMVRRN